MSEQVDIRARLDEIKARAEKAAQFGMYGQEPSTLRGYNVPVLYEALRADVPWLIEYARQRDAALTAVLDLADRLDWEAHPQDPGGRNELDWTRIVIAQRIRDSITEQLGGGRG